MSTISQSLTKDQYEQIVKLLGSSDASRSSFEVKANMRGTPKNNSNIDFWIIDTRATNHMTYRVDWLNNGKRIID